jgi:hypothetical protein
MESGNSKDKDLASTLVDSDLNSHGLGAFQSGRK